MASFAARAAAVTARHSRAVVSTGNGISILDPNGGFRYTVNTDNKTVQTYTLRTPAPVIVNGQARRVEPIILNAQGGSIATTVDGDKIRAAVEEAKAAAQVAVGKMATTVTMAAPVAMAMPSTSGQKWETRTEQLGTQNFEGVDAEGTRTITTIPADAIGNERPIEIVYERWYSKELQMIVYSKHSDPRFGEQTYRLTNINRSEPDPSLFQVPTSYRIVNQPSFYNRTTVNTRATVERVSTSKTAQASRP